MNDVRTALVQSVANVIQQPDLDKTAVMFGDFLDRTELLKNRVIANNTDAAAITDGLAIFGNARRKLEELRVDLVTPHNDELKSINGFFRAMREEIESTEKTTSKSLLAYNKEQERLAEEKAELERKAEADRLRLEAEEKAEIAIDDESYPDEQLRDEALADGAALERQAERVEAAPIEEVKVRSRGISTGAASRTNKRWFATVTDRSKLPDEYLVIDQKALDAVARALKDKFNVPGAKADYTEKLSVQKMRSID